MTKNPRNNSSVWLDDLLALAPIEYFLIIQKESLALYRLGRRNEIKTLFTHKYTSSAADDIFTVAFRAMRDSGVYYGQPLTVIINNGSDYSYIKHTDASGISKLSDRVAFLQSDKHDLRNRLINLKSGGLFVTQAIEKTSLEQLVAAADAASLNVTNVLTLSAALVAHRLIKPGKQASLDLIRFPDGTTSYLIDDGKESILFGTHSKLLTPDELAPAARQYASTYLDSDPKIKISIYDRTTEKTSDFPMLSTGTLLRKAISNARVLKGLAYLTNRSKMATRTRTFLNAAKLLIMVLGSALVLSSLVAGLTAVMASSGSESIAEFQQKYGQRLALEQRRASLLDRETETLNQLPEKSNAAAIVSAFCQATFNSISLNKIRLSRPANGDSTYVEITGVANSEGTIFRYLEETNLHVEPCNLTLSSIKPDIASFRGRTDTTLTFKLTMVAND